MILALKQYPNIYSFFGGSGATKCTYYVILFSTSDVGRFFLFLILPSFISFPFFLSFAYIPPFANFYKFVFPGSNYILINFTL